MFDCRTIIGRDSSPFRRPPIYIFIYILPVCVVSWLQQFNVFHTSKTSQTFYALSFFSSTDEKKFLFALVLFCACFLLLTLFFLSTSTRCVFQLIDSTQSLREGHILKSGSMGALMNEPWLSANERPFTIDRRLENMRRREPIHIWRENRAREREE